MIHNDSAVAPNEAQTRLASRVGESDVACPICLQPLASARWGVAGSPCGRPGRVGRYHLACWERAVATRERTEGADGAFLVPAFVDSDQGRSRCDRGRAECSANRSRDASDVDFRGAVGGMFDAAMLRRRFGAAVDDAGIRWGARLERMEADVEMLLQRVLDGEANEVAFGAFAVGVLLGAMSIEMDERMSFPGVSVVRTLPWLIRALWLCVLPLILPDAVRTTGAAIGAKEPMTSLVAIVAGCALSVPLWLAVGEMVFIAILMNMAGDVLR